MKDPAFLFYPGDWLGGTMGMSLEQKGGYLELLMMQFNLGQFTEAHAKQVLGICFDEVWPTVMQKFNTDGIYYWNERLRLEIKRRREFCDSRRSNGLGEKKTMHMDKQVDNQMEDEDQNELNRDQFSIFWHSYHEQTGKPKTDRVKAEKTWKSLPTAERQIAIDRIPQYVATQEDSRFLKKACNYLLDKAFNDEMKPYNTALEANTNKILNF